MSANQIETVFPQIFLRLREGDGLATVAVMTDALSARADLFLIVVSDEVWEHVVFDGRPHLTLLAAPGMADRVVKIGSAGKMFGLTGWKVGFACGSPDLITPLAKAH